MSSIFSPLLACSLFCISSYAQIPHLKRAILPGYSELARYAGIQGIVKTELQIANGRVESFKILTGQPQLGSTLEHLQDWVFDSDAPPKLVLEIQFILHPAELGPPFKGAENFFTELESPNLLKIHYKRPVLTK